MSREAQERVSGAARLNFEMEDDERIRYVRMYIMSMEGAEMDYQADFGDGYENIHPDGYGMHETACCGEVRCEDCAGSSVSPDDGGNCKTCNGTGGIACKTGCWSPETGDPDIWFAAIFEQGAERARCGSGAWQYEYTSDEWAEYIAAKASK